MPASVGRRTYPTAPESRLRSDEFDRIRSEVEKAASQLSSALYP
ncbi:hypothetical protein [Brucella endophytica]|nr:hypothetical protein [Brucella endophytica]